MGRATNVFTNHIYTTWRVYAVHSTNPYSPLKPLAWLVDYSVAGIDPCMGIGPAYAMHPESNEEQCESGRYGASGGNFILLFTMQSCKIQMQNVNVTKQPKNK